jgi:hypothetical protein
MAKCQSAQPNFPASRIPFTSSPQLLCAKTTQYPCMNGALLMEAAKLRTTVYTIKYWCQMTFWNFGIEVFLLLSEARSVYCMGTSICHNLPVFPKHAPLILKHQQAWFLV